MLSSHAKQVMARVARNWREHKSSIILAGRDAEELLAAGLIEIHQLAKASYLYMPTRTVANLYVPTILGLIMMRKEATDAVE